jgi:hypothetical protein
MWQALTFDKYKPELDGFPNLDPYQWEWPVEIDLFEKECLIRQAGFDPIDRPRLGILDKSWLPKSGKEHPAQALIVAPHINFTDFSDDEHFAVSREPIQRAK